MMQSSTRRVRPGRAIVVMFMISGLMSCGSSSGGEDPVRVELETMGGESTTISAALQDRPLLVSLWAVWCQPCRRELPELQRIADSKSGVDVLAVNVGDDPERIAAFLDEMSLDLPVVIDPVGDLLTILDVGTVPATVLFDSSGTILWSHLGAVSAQQVHDAVQTYVTAN